MSFKHDNNNSKNSNSGTYFVACKEVFTRIKSEKTVQFSVREVRCVEEWANVWEEGRVI